MSKESRREKLRPEPLLPSRSALVRRPCDGVDPVRGFINSPQDIRGDSIDRAAAHAQPTCTRLEQEFASVLGAPEVEPPEPVWWIVVPFTDETAGLSSHYGVD